MTNYLPDIYKISETVHEIQKKYINEDDDTLTMGIYGYLNEVHSNSLQNAILLASEYGNEAIPIRSKYERTILTNAVTYDVQDINAKPAKMTVMIGFLKDTLDKYIDTNKNFILDRYCDLDIGGYTFHLDYDVIINRNILMNKTVLYSAKYDMNFINTLSDITNPYLQSPIVTNIQGDDYLFVICQVTQTFLDLDSTKVISNNVLESKTYEFQFDNQLAGFNIKIKEVDEEIELTPVYEGMPYDNDDFYCYYTYLDENRIRIKFDRDSYQPSLNSEISLEIYTTLGEKGNFSYKQLSLLPLNSTRFEYKSIQPIIQPMTDSTNGRNRKTVDELQSIIPKRMLARGGIINNKDLQNYFDMIDVDNRLIVFKKRFNQMEHLYYAYLIAKDTYGDIIPTNTIDIQLTSREFDAIYDDRMVIKPGRHIYYTKDGLGYYDPDFINYDESDIVFDYASPFIIVVNKDPLSVSYYLDVINRDYNLKHDFINQNSPVQFIATTINEYKNYINGDEYIFTMNITQNVNNDKNIVVYKEDENGSKTEEIDHINIRPVFCITDDKKKYYIEGQIIDYDNGTFTYTVEFRFSSDICAINKQNQILLNGLTVNTKTESEDVFVKNITNAAIYLYLTNEVEDVEADGNYNQDLFAPDIESNSILVNKYNITDDIILFYNYSTTINTVVEVLADLQQEPMVMIPEGEENMENYLFEIKSNPVVRHDYIYDELRLSEFIDYIHYRKCYIDGAQDLMEDSFNIDLKFFNTYGPSKLFRIGRKDELIDRLNISLQFIIKLDSVSKIDCIDDIKNDIKSYIEDINEISSLHMSNVCHYIKQEYEDIVTYIEFVGINNYDTLYQYIEKREPDILTEVPEFITINLDEDMQPDINITIY